MDSISDYIKWICSAAAFILSLIGLAFSVLIKKKADKSRLNLFSSGVLFASGFVYLLEVAANEIELYGKTPYPVSGTTAVSVFSLFTIIHVFFGSQNDLNINSNEEAETFNARASARFSFSQQDITKGSHHDIDTEFIDYDSNDDQSNACSTELINPNEDGTKGNSAPDKSKKKLPIIFILIYIFFLLNSILEGLKMGLDLPKKEFIPFAVNVLARKIFEAFLIGIFFLINKPKWAVFYALFATYVLLFPIGTTLGIYLDLEKNNLVFGILLSAVAGAFVYVGVCKWAIIFLNRRIWTHTEKFWHLGLFAFGCLYIILASIAFV